MPPRGSASTAVAAADRRTATAPRKGPAASKPVWGPAPAARDRQASASHVKQLMEMGFTEEVAKRALAECVWDVNQALDMLLSGALPAAPMDDASVARAGPNAAAPEAKAEAGMKGVGREDAATASGSGFSSGVSSPLQSSRAWEDFQSTAAGSDVTGEAENQSEASRVTSPSRCSPAKASESPVRAGKAPEELEEHGEIAAGKLVLVAEVLSQPDAVPPIECDTTAKSDCVTTAAALQLERAVRAWAAAESGQLTVEAGIFLSVWPSSGTDNGWIYAELLGKHSGDASDAKAPAGWLPTFVLEELSSHERWMRVVKSAEAVHDTQLDIAEGSVLKVNVPSLTGLGGWAYAQTSEGDGAGWIPVSHIDWVEV